LLLPIVVPIVSIVVLAASLLGDATVGGAITAALGTGVTVAIQTVFWLTLVFAAIERFAGTNAGAPGLTGSGGWTLDDLPDLPEDGRMGMLEAASSVAANVFVVTGLLWVQLQSPFVVDGQSFPLFDPALWSFWLPYFLAVAVLEVGFTIALYLRGHWTWGFAAANAILGAAFAIPAVWLLQNGMLLNPALVAAVDAATNDTWLVVTAIVMGVTVIVIAAWDAIDGFRKAAAHHSR
jgi:hypothetical protein